MMRAGFGDRRVANGDFAEPSKVPITVRRDHRVAALTGVCASWQVARARVEHIVVDPFEDDLVETDSRNEKSRDGRARLDRNRLVILHRGAASERHDRAGSRLIPSPARLLALPFSHGIPSTDEGGRRATEAEERVTQQLRPHD